MNLHKHITNATRIPVPPEVTADNALQWLRDAHPEMGIDGIAAYVWRAASGHVLAWVPMHEIPRQDRLSR